MAWLSAPLTMPADAGADRSGGTRLQMPNVQRTLQGGGIAWSLVADATLTYLGTPYTLAGGAYAACDDGGVTLLLPTHYYIVYVLVSAPTALRACKQENWAATYGAADCLGLAYLTDHYDIDLPLFARAGGCTNLNPTPTVLNDGTYTIPATWAGPPADGTLLSAADLSHLIGMAYDATTGNLVLSLGEGGASPPYAGGITTGQSALYKVAGDGVMHRLAGLCGSLTGYLTHLDALFTAYWQPHGFIKETIPADPILFPAPEAQQMLCRGGKLYTLQLVTGANNTNDYRMRLNPRTHFLDYTMAAGFIRSYDLTSGVVTVIAAITYTFPNLTSSQDFLGNPPLAMDGSGTFYSTYYGWERPDAPGTAYYGGIFQIAPGAGVVYVSCIEQDIGNPDFVFEAIPTAWAGGKAVSPFADANFADGLTRTLGSTGVPDALATDGHDTVLFHGQQLTSPGNPLDNTHEFIRAVDAGTGAFRTVIGSTNGFPHTTYWSGTPSPPAYPGDTGIGNDGSAADSGAATWGLFASRGRQDIIGINRGSERYTLCVDRAANVAYYRDGGLEAIRSIKLDDQNMLCTLTGGPSIVSGDTTHGLILGPAQGMRAYWLPFLAVDESTGNLYYASATDNGGSNHYARVKLYRAKFY